MGVTLNNQVYSFSLLTVANMGFDLQTADTLEIADYGAEANITYVNVKQGC
jgi:hypothetical protein